MGTVRPVRKGLLINARSETVLTKPFFRSDFENRRCLIPAHGFYEWDAEKKKKYYLKGTTVQCFFLAEYSEGLKPTINV